MKSAKLFFGFVLFVVASLMPVSAQAQTGQISGTVTDSLSEQSLPGVNIVIEDLQKGTATGPNGTYTISNVEPGTYTLRATFVGYDERVRENVQVLAGQTTTVDFVMRQQQIGLDEVVVVGYGEQQRQDLTGSVSSISAADIERTPVSNVSQTLQGRAAGVQVIQNNGQPGSPATVRIRGSNSISGGNDPLYVIDGFPVSNTEFGNTSVLSTISPSNIESIEILKDASATAIYGARGANGVILITTKDGRVGETQVTFDTYYGAQNVRRQIDLLEPRQFAEIANERARNDAPEGEDPGLPFEDLDNLPAATDWQNEVFRTGTVQKYGLSVSGGSDDGDTQYLVSGNYFDEEGIVLGSDFRRGSARLNLGQQVYDPLRVTARLTLSRGDANRALTEGGDATTVVSTLSAPPVVPVRDRSGGFANVKPFGFSPPTLENPVAIATEPTNKLTTNRVLGNVAAEYELTGDLTLKVLGGTDYTDLESESYLPRTIDAGGTAGSAGREEREIISWLSENTLTYQNDFADDHRVNATAGFTYQHETNSFTSAGGSGFPNDRLGTFGLSAASEVNTPGAGLTDWTLLSWLGRVNYALMNRYLFTVTGRADGSSRFGAGNKWAYFPSAALGWRVSEESFMDGVDALSNLKLRASWGLSGNQAIDPYQSLQRLGARLVQFGSELEAGFGPVNVGNPDLQWETTRQLDIGLEAGFFGQRLRLTSDYYRKTTDDLLAAVQLPGSSGFTNSIQNVGEIQNVGFEVAANADIFTGEAFRWSMGANLSHNENEVLEVASGNEFFAAPVYNLFPSTHIVREGLPLSSFYGFEEIGVNNETGLIEYVDQNGDGTINNEDRVVLGDPYPDYTVGFNTDVSYGGFELSALVTAAQGIERFNANLYFNADAFDRGRNQIADVMDYWTPQNRDAAWPKISSDVNLKISDRFIEDASYVRLQNVRLAYDVPLGKLGLGQARSASLYVNARNLLTLTDYSWFNPEVNTFGSGDLRVGTDFASYPTARTFTVGLQLGL